MKRARTSPVGWPGQGASPRLPKPDNPAVALRSVDRLEVPCNRPTQDGSATVPPSIARGLFREHDTILLDEPTASIDPLEEQAVYYERFMKIAARRTAIIVTHRLASPRRGWPTASWCWTAAGSWKTAATRNCLPAAACTTACSPRRPPGTGGVDEPESRPRKAVAVHSWQIAPA